MLKNEEKVTVLSVVNSDNGKIDKPVKSHLTTTKIAYIAMFVAINVVVGALSPRIGSLKITLSYTVGFLAGYFFGPVAGILTGCLGDLLGSLLGGYAPNPIILIGNTLICLIPALVKYVKIPFTKKTQPYVHSIISYILVFIVCTLFINTYGLYVLGMAKGASFWVYMGIRAGTQAPIVAINLALTFVAYPMFERIFKSMKIVTKN